MEKRVFEAGNFRIQVEDCNVEFMYVNNEKKKGKLTKLKLSWLGGYELSFKEVVKNEKEIIHITLVLYSRGNINTFKVTGFSKEDFEKLKQFLESLMNDPCIEAYKIITKET